MHRVSALSFFAVLSLAACAQAADEASITRFGPNPTLPEPDKQLIPRVDIAEAVGWPAGAKPTPAPGLAVNAFATGLDHPRWVYTLPNGDVLVAETNAPPKPEDSKGVKGWFMKKTMKKAGAAPKSANRITLLRDADHDGTAETKTVFLKDLNSPFGMALVGHDFYVADSDAVLRFPYQDGETTISAKPEKIVDLPAGPINHHWTKNIIANPDGSKLYATVGSNSNVAEKGMAAEEDRAAIWEIDPKTRSHRLFATGIRNPNGLGWQPETGVLWTAVNERDEIGDDLVPDYLTSVKDGGFYGWPYSYWGQHVDKRVDPQNPTLVARAIKPDYSLGAHTASLGLAFGGGEALPEAFHHGAFIGQHGSWNRIPKSGYKVVFIPFVKGQPSGEPKDVLTGFLGPEEKAYGRPVGVALDGQSNLLVADDVGNAIWHVSASR